MAPLLMRVHLLQLIRLKLKKAVRLRGKPMLKALRYWLV